MNFYVYGHFIKDTNELFYIGKGSGGRAYNMTARNTYHKRIQNKYKIIVKFFQTGLSEIEAFAKEFELIKKYKNLGFCKCNLYDGGKGRSFGFEVSEKTKEALRRANLGKDVSLETREKMSKARKGKNHSPETIKKMRYGRKVTERHKQAIREKNGGKNSSNWSGYVFTPMGRFETDREAEKHLNLSRSTIKRRCSSPRFKEWYRCKNG